jgi:hypothetical protein
VSPNRPAAAVQIASIVFVAKGLRVGTPETTGNTGGVVALDPEIDIVAIVTRTAICRECGVSALKKVPKITLAHRCYHFARTTWDLHFF